MLYARGPNYNTTCALHKINFDGSGHMQLTAVNLPNNTFFIGSPDTSKILYCDGSASSWDIWIMNPDGTDPTQLTYDTANDYLGNICDNVWSLGGKSFYFTSERSGNGDIYKMNIDGTNLLQMTKDDAPDFLPIPSPDGLNLAYLSQQADVNNIWLINLAAPFISQVKDVPNDQGGHVTVQWRTSNLDSDADDVSFYSIWRALPAGADPAVAGQKITKEYFFEVLRPDIDYRFYFIFKFWTECGRFDENCW